jgi:predicted nucleotidyltransferase
MSVLIKPTLAFDLTKRNRSKLLSSLKKSLLGRVEAAYIFGSFAENTHNKNSDIDIILIQKTKIKFTERALQFTDLFDIYPDLDILVYTPEEFERQMSGAQFGFWASVKKSRLQIL